MTNIQQKIKIIEEKQADRILEVLGSVGVSPKCMRYYFEAFTHRSFKAENEWPYADNERYEFLGDSILQSTISLFLIDRNIEATEGELTLLRTMFVRSETLTTLTMNLKLYPALLLSKGEAEQAHKFEVEFRKNNPFTLKYEPYCDLFEAFMAAYVMDIGLKHAMKWLRNLFNDVAGYIHLETYKKDAKTHLQELLQSQCHKLPKYSTKLDKANPKNGFYTEVYLEDTFLGCGYGKTKKSSQQGAAHNALQKKELLLGLK